MAEAMKIKAVAGWYGGNRTLAARVGDELGQLDWCGVPFCGGCPELPLIRCRGGVASDLHRHVVNLCRVIADDATAAQLVDLVRSRLFHPDELCDAQRRCEAIEESLDEVEPDSPLWVRRLDRLDGIYADKVRWAADYFVCCWMGRGGMAGKFGEFRQSLALRFTSSGGDSAKRYHSAIDSLRAWSAALRRWSFAIDDAFRVLSRVVDRRGHGVYCDPPWPQLGDDYNHRFHAEQHLELARVLSGFEHVRVVVRYGDHPIIRKLYPASRWRWVEQTSTNQRGGDVREVLIVNGGPIS